MEYFVDAPIWCKPFRRLQVSAPHDADYRYDKSIATAPFRLQRFGMIYVDEFINGKADAAGLVDQ